MLASPCYITRLEFHEVKMGSALPLASPPWETCFQADFQAWESISGG